MENKKYECSCVGHSIFYELMLFQPSRSKTVGEDRFLAEKVSLFGGREKHQNVTILTMCKIYNINNSKTADI